MRYFHVHLMTVLALLLFGFAGQDARAQSVRAPHIAAQLVSETDYPAPGQHVTLAFVMTPANGWHGYWENPGDAGKGMDLRWSLPTGASVGALRYPVPETLLLSGLMNHVYEGRYAVLVDVVIPAKARSGDVLPINVHADWLACTQTICVPEQQDLSINLTIGDGKVSPSRRAEFDGFRARLPRPLGGQARFEVRGEIARIAIPFPVLAQITQPYFFRKTDGATSYAAPQTISRNGNAVIVEARWGGPAVPRLDGVLRIGDHAGLAISAVPGAVPAAGAPITTDREAQDNRGKTPIFLALAGALLGGLLLNIMPCVFPILSLKAISLARSGGDPVTAKREALAYSAGVMLTCLALGGALLALRAGGASVGWAFQLQNPAVILLLLVLAWAIALNLAGLFHLNAIDAGEDLTRKGGAHGAFWTGVLVAFVATPCTGPFMAAALGAALVLPVAAALSVFAGLGLGLALPFLAIAYIPAIRRAMPRPGAWMATFQKILSVPMVLTAAALLWLVWRQGGQAALGIAAALIVAVTITLLLLGGAQRRGKSLGLVVAVLVVAMWGVGAKSLPVPSARNATAGDAVAFSDAALASARAKHNGVFLYFTADWCLSCKVNEAAAIDRAEVRAAFEKAGVTMMVGDWTNGDPVIGRFLEAHGRSGVPLYLWYAPGAGSPRVLPQILTPAMLVALPSQDSK
jgi:DsbC/DsbD-like thiol-disulfide interchange protein/cytochrome c biogenesis protein CcdA